MKKLVLTLLIGVTTLTAFSQVPSYVPTNGLVGYWPFNGNANDESGNGNNGTVNGATLTVDRNGVANNAFNFDGINDYININSTSGLTTSLGMSMSIWFKWFGPNGTDNHQYFYQIAPNPNGAITILDNGVLGINVANCNCSSDIGIETNIIQNTWYNITLTYDLQLGLLKMYLNGNLINQSQENLYSYYTVNNTASRFGNYYFNSHHFKGELDNGILWNRALTHQEITDLYNSQNCINPLALVTPQSTTTFCQGGSVILNASTGTGYTYEWYKDGNIVNSSIGSSYTANQSGSYTVKVINGSCSSTSSATTVTVNPNPTATLTPQSTTTFCQNGSVVLNASTAAGNTYEWYKDGNIVNSSIGSSYTANQSGSYTVKVINGSCSSTSSATTVTVNPNPTATLTPQSTTTFCQGGSVVLNASTGSGYTYEWYKNGNIINGSITSSYIANQSGNYTVKVINGSCSSTSSATTVTANPNPTVSLSLANFIHIKATPVTLAGSPSGGTYIGTGVVGSTFSSTNAGLGKKTITYNYTSGAGCSGSATAITTVYDTTACSTFDTLFINIAVTGLTAPNNLGTLKIWPNPANDHITIDNGNYGILSGYSVKIETVLGQEVFKSAINQQQFSVDLTTWKGKGIYLVHILDGQNNIIETKKIVLL
jgi:hypothetical protein